MTLQTWLADELRAAGLVVLEVAGWESRETRVGFAPGGIVWHDTVTPPGLSRVTEQAILRDGRPDLDGPLAQLGIHRDGAVSVVAAGRCSHNGGGPGPGGIITKPLWGNDSFGLEVFCYGGEPGHVEPYNAAQRDSVARASAVICKHFGWTAIDHCRGHKETDPTRKVDPFDIDCHALREATSSAMTPNPNPPDPGGDPLAPLNDADLSYLAAAQRVSAVLDLYAEVYGPTYTDTAGVSFWVNDPKTGAAVLDYGHLREAFLGAVANDLVAHGVALKP